MENQEATRKPTPEEVQEAANKWTRDTLDRAHKHLAEKGIIPKTILDKESRYLVPMCAIWKIKSQQGKTYWVVSGNLPTGHVEVTAATSAREAVRYFSFQWQLKADEIVNSGRIEKAQADFASLLVARAQGLYELYNNDKLWTNEPK